jgi:hypothetical protein
MAFGHPLERVWAMTPRQAAAWVALGFGRERRNMAAQLFVARTAAHGKDESVQKQLREWEQS